MDLFEDDLLEEKKKVKKIGTGIIIAAVIVVILIIGVVAALSYYQSKQLGMYVDGMGFGLSSSTVIVEESGKIYISIKDVSDAFGYKYYNGTYGTASEDTKKGFVQTKADEEVASFEMNSKKIYKILLNDNARNNEYDYLYIDEPVRYVNGNLYTTLDGIKRIFNVDISYDQNTNKISAYTLAYLDQYYTTNIASFGYNQIDERFYNLKTIPNGMIVVKNDSGKYGVIDTQGKEIIGAKYSEITYIEATNEFLVENNDKVGMVNNLGRTRIALEYDDLKLLDNDSGLYIAKNNNRYGVINKQGTTIIHLEYDEIGIDKTLYKDTEITNPYLLYDTCIPVLRNKKWGIYNKTGKLLVPIEYDTIGCVVTTNQNASANNALLLSDYEAIIIGKNVEENNETQKSYAVVNTRGEFLVQFGSSERGNIVNSIYYVTENGEDIYQIEVNGKTGNLDEVFKANNIQKVNKDIIDPESEGGGININQNIISNEDSQTQESTGEIEGSTAETSTEETPEDATEQNQ